MAQVFQFPEKLNKTIIDAFKVILDDVLEAKNMALARDLKSKRDEVLALVEKHGLNNLKYEIDLPSRLTPDEVQSIETAVQAIATRYSEILTDILAELAISKINESRARYGKL